ncbi:Haloacid dehalogenase [Carnobacterium maltaromaticum]|uniref:Cof-type HAD-IIB family hydrolase n=1 Tax=Carnobacterium maltaromaticum TaxID=2751 RepID=UPI00191BC766|nr:Cof-type HAD-IIB family hydrolase [Carnobacterium maltaromaticum]CAD5899801.1 Haloacid dehalogenase [Carnobacterium maltaromaticum]
MIKLIAIDIDGTLLNSQHRLTQKVIETIKRAKAQGVKIVLCTGRPIVGILPYLEKLDLLDSTDIAITQNGALVQETASKKVLSHLTIELEQLKEIEKFSKTQKAQLTFFDDKKMYTLHPEPNKLLFDDAKLLHTELTVIDKKDLSSDMLLTKAMFLGDSTEIDQLLLDLPPSFYDEFYCVRSVSYNFEFLNRGASKGEALKVLAESLNLKPENVMAIGDAENDRSMLEYAGSAVVMENALLEIQALATFVTKSNDNDGVAFAIEELVLTK